MTEDDDFYGDNIREGLPTPREQGFNVVHYTVLATMVGIAAGAEAADGEWLLFAASLALVVVFALMRSGRNGRREMCRL